MNGVVTGKEGAAGMRRLWQWLVGDGAQAQYLSAAWMRKQKYTPPPLSGIRRWKKKATKALSRLLATSTIRSFRPRERTAIGDK